MVTSEIRVKPVDLAKLHCSDFHGDPPCPPHVFLLTITLAPGHHRPPLPETAKIALSPTALPRRGRGNRCAASP